MPLKVGASIPLLTIKQRTNVMGIFPNDASITRLVGATMLEQNDEWSLNRRCSSAFSGLWTYTMEWDATKTGGFRPPLPVLRFGE
jgi:hypothetical protein